MKSAGYAHLVVVSAFVVFCCWVVISVLVGFPLENDPFFRITGMHRRQQITVAAASGLGLVSVLFLTRLRGRRSRHLSVGTVLAPLSLITLNAFLLSAPSLHEELSGGEFSLVLSYVVFIFGLQASLLYLAARSFTSGGAIPMAAALFATLNVYSIYLIFLPDYRYLPDLARSVVLVAAGLSFSGLFLGLTRQNGLSTPSVVVKVLSVMVGVALLSGSAELATSRARTSSDPLDDVAAPFRSAPDVHVVSFESLQSPELLETHLDIHEVPFQEILRDSSTRVFRNSFSRYPSTLLSLNSFLRLDRHASDPANVYVSGRGRSEVIEMFESNGYWTQTGYANSYFGRQGEHVDGFHPQTGDLGRSTLCRFTVRSPAKLFGICRLASWYARSFGSEAAWKDTYVELLSSLVEKDEPLFTFHHMLEPGHTGHLIGRFSLDDPAQRNAFRDAYLDRLGSVEEILNRAIEVLERRQRPYFLLVFGDHGPWLSRGMPRDVRDPFVVRDRHGVINLVILNGVQCADDDLMAYSRSYSTPARAMSGVLRCMVRNPAVIDHLAAFHEPYEFERFAYE